METVAPSGVSPSTPAEPTVPASPEARSLEQPTNEQNFTNRASSAKSPKDIRAVLSDLRKAKPDPKVEASAPGQPAAEPAPAAEVPAPVVEETPAAEPEVVPEPETPAEEPEEEPNLDGPVTPSQAKKLRLRLPENDQAGRLAAAFMQRNRDWTLSQAMDAANKQLGLTPAAAEATPAAPKSDLPETIEAVDSTLTSLDADREKALTELRFEDVAKIDRKVRQLDRHRTNLEREGERQQATAVRAYEQKFTASEAKATELYPDASKSESDFGKRMAEIDADLEANRDPLFNSPDKPLRIAQMVAAEKSIAPRKKGAPVAAPAKAAVPAVVAPKKGIVPSGASRTVVPTTTPQDAIVAQVANIKSVHGLRAFLKPLTRR